jgi:fibronectin type 3 domain-containing protein
MFDVHALTNCRSATVTLMPNRVDDPMVTMYYELAPTNWTENGITWNNQPGGTGVFLTTNTVNVGVPTVFDVTGAAASQATNGGLLSIRITQPTNNLNGLVEFCSKECLISSWRPLLTYTPSFGSSPAGLAANAVSASQINLCWTASSGANYYNVRRSVTSGGPYTTVATGIMTTNYSDTGLNSSTTYYYAVSAVYNGGESVNSTQAGATTPSLPPPSTLTATLVGNQVALNWPAVNGANSYDVKRGWISGGPYTTIAIGVTGTNYTDTANYTGASYYYVVTGVDAGGEGAYSPEASVTTPAILATLPVADAYVNDGSSSNSNFGMLPNLDVKCDGGTNTGFNRITYLKFNVQALTNVQSAQLILTPYWVTNSGTTYTNVNDTLAFAWVTNDAWTETGITWSNQPGNSGVIFTNLNTNYMVGVPVTVNIPGSVVASQATNDGYLSVEVYAIASTVGLIQFCSKEFPTNSYQPALQLANPGNTAPTLAAISNRTIGVGLVLSITNTATDSDVPAQTLTFSLPTAPTNAAINSGSGVLTWRPLVTQANTTNAFTVMVADSGTPTKIATQSFVVTVTNLAKPVVSTVTPLVGQLVLQVNGASGPDYQIQSSTNLTGWTAVFTTNAPAMPFAWTNSTTGSPRNFFRILVGPPF